MWRNESRAEKRCRDGCLKMGVGRSKSVLDKQGGVSRRAG